MRAPCNLGSTLIPIKELLQEQIILIQQKVLGTMVEFLKVFNLLNLKNSLIECLMINPSMSMLLVLLLIFC